MNYWHSCANRQHYPIDRHCSNRKSTSILILRMPKTEGEHFVKPWKRHKKSFLSKYPHASSDEEKMLCNGKTKSAWIHGGLPCHGTASYAEGFPDVFSLAMDARAGSARMFTGE